MATIALFVALGGTSVAALRVGSKQIADNSVRSADVRNNGLMSRDIRNGQVMGADVRNGTLTSRDLSPDSVGSAAVGGLTAGDFAPGQLPPPLPSTLPSGKSLSGAFGAAVTGGNGIARSPVSFGVPLARAPLGAFYIGAGDPGRRECPGSFASPTAAPGYLCLYEANVNAPVTFRGFFDPVTGHNFEASRFGAVVFVNGDAGGAVRGTWAVTGQ